MADWVDNPVAATELCLDRIARFNPRLRAFVSIDAEGALLAAREAEQRRVSGCILSAIDGLPVGIKANIAVRDWTFHAGIEAYRLRVAPGDADCVARLREGGAVLLGLLNMDEAALGDTTDNPFFGRTENPRHPGATAGGSSGGSAAAVAAGLCEAALGTDTLGSVRIPAAFCGVIGHKPPPGLLSTVGVVPLAPAFDTVGILAETAATVRALRCWLGPAFPTDAVGMSGRIGIFPVDGMEIDPIVDAAFADTVDKARQLGFDVRPIPRLPRGLREIAKAALLVVELAAAVIHAAERARNPAGFSRGFRDMLGWAESQTQARRQSARALIAEAEADIRQAFAPYDAVLMPTTPCLEFAFGPDRPRNTADFTVLANIAGLAATAFPVGRSSVQAVGGNEALCLSLAEQLTTPS